MTLVALGCTIDPTYDQLEAGAAFRDSESLPRGSAFRVDGAVVAVRVNGTALAADAFFSQPVSTGSLVWLRDEVAAEAMIEF